MKRILLKCTMAAAILSLGSCTNLDPEFYSEAAPDTYPKSAGDLISLMGEPYARVGTQLGAMYWVSQEGTADCFVTLIRGRKSQFNDGWNRIHDWDWHKMVYQVCEPFILSMSGVSGALNVIADIENVDYPAIGLTNELKETHIAELKTLMAFFYLNALDGYGGAPIYRSITGPDQQPKASSQETFDYIEELLTQSLPKLHKRGAGEMLDRTVHQGAAAALLARLYLNAEAYTGTPKFDKCRTICNNFLQGEYGVYGISDNWQEVHGFTNKSSQEMIWCVPSEDSKWTYNWFHAWFWHPGMFESFDNGIGSPMNAICLQPSRDPAGKIYSDAEFRLGKPYEKFHPADLRKKQYKYHPDGTYEGMFMVGPQYKWDSTEPILGRQEGEYKDKPLVLVDQVAYLSEGGTESDVWHGEENSGIRMVKVPIPNGNSNPLSWAAAQPVIRYAEIYYMLAECEMRLGDGDKQRACDLINEVKARNFEGGILPTTDPAGTLVPGTLKVAALDNYRMLDEWLVEFLGEGRRRTDLIRFGMWTTEKWWDHTNTPYSDHFNVLPFSYLTLSGNQLIKQNPGYGN